MIIYTIYKFANNVNGKIYIGFTNNITRRISEHKLTFTKSKSKFYNAIRKHGWNNFQFDIIYQSKDGCYCKNVMEPFFIKEYNSHKNGYNSTAGGEVTGFDSGPGNMLMDAWIHEHQGNAFDENGNWALQGKVNEALLTKMLADAFFTKVPPKSTGRDDFHLQWLQEKLGGENYLCEDVQATLLHLTAHSALEALARHAPQTQKLIVCGGGARNNALMNVFKVKSQHFFKQPLEITTSESAGIDPQLVEGLAFAWLAWAHKEKRPANLPAVTGAKGPRILGACYPA